MDPLYSTAGIPWVYTHHQDVLPYSLGILVTVDDRVPGQGVVIESLEVEYEDGETYVAIRPDCARGGPFRVFERLPSDRVPGRTFRMARIDVARAVWRRGNFKMTIKGHVYGNNDVPFVRLLRMDYSRETNLYLGWRLVVMSAAG
ncbi:hypothetical protein HQ560_01995 [bacterium]|nr:hypothetical protein [bacterium]